MVYVGFWWYSARIHVVGRIVQKHNTLCKSLLDNKNIRIPNSSRLPRVHAHITLSRLLGIIDKGISITYSPRLPTTTRTYGYHTLRTLRLCS